MTLKRFGSIYLIRNLFSGKVYVGQTTGPLNRRFRDHMYVRATSSHKLARAVRKYGKAAFAIEELAICFTREALDECEISLIRALDAIASGYNCKSGGSYGRHSDHTKHLLAERSRNNPHWKKALKLAVARNTGRHLSAETRRKIGIALRGRPNSKLRGRRLSEATKQKIAVAMRGRVIAPVHRERIAATLRGKSFLTERGRSRIATASAARRTTAATRLKLSIGKQGAKNPRFGKGMPDKARLKRSRVIVRSDGVLFPSLSEAARQMACTPASICHVLRGRQVTYKGFSFAYTAVAHQALARTGSAKSSA